MGELRWPTAQVPVSADTRPGHSRRLALQCCYSVVERTVYVHPELVTKLAAQTAIGSNGEFADLDGPTVFLASSAGCYSTGQIIYLDGGFTIK